MICSLSVVWESTRLLSFRRVLAMSRKNQEVNLSLDSGTERDISPQPSDLSVRLLSSPTIYARENTDPPGYVTHAPAEHCAPRTAPAAKTRKLSSIVYQIVLHLSIRLVTLDPNREILYSAASPRHPGI